MDGNRATNSRGRAAAPRLRSYRRSTRRWKLETLADHLGISVSQAQRIETGSSEPSLAVAVAIERLGPGAPRVEDWPSLAAPVRELLALRAGADLEVA